jgi:hypothetical protein
MPERLRWVKPGQRLPRHHRLAAMVPVLIEHGGEAQPAQRR